MTSNPYRPDNARRRQLLGYRGDNFQFATHNQNEEWMWRKLLQTNWEWARQGLWSNRMFDFWCSKLGVAIEVDGPEHDAVRDRRRDAWVRSSAGIIVLRARNRNEDDAAVVLGALPSIGLWRYRIEAIKALGPTQKWQFRVRPIWDFRHMCDISNRDLTAPFDESEIPW